MILLFCYFYFKAEVDNFYQDSIILIHSEFSHPLS
jgi:hypothetical protein